MKPKIKVPTLAASDLERSLAFYRDGLGLPTEGPVGQELKDGAVVFFHLNDDLILALYPATSLAKDAGTATDPAREPFWGGCSDCFHDPDGHLWEVAWNPEWPAAG
jgi:uncharacterized protein